MLKIKIIINLDIIAILHVNIEVNHNLRLNVLIKIPVGFLNWLHYYYHFIIKELANDFKGEFEYLAEKTEKYKTFSVLISKKVKRFDKDGNKSVITISYKIKFTDKARFMAN